MRTLGEAVDKIKNIKEIGYIRTQRPGPTGIGKTLEDLLEIKENNIDISNTTFAELKSARKSLSSYAYPFHKST